MKIAKKGTKSAKKSKKYKKKNAACLDLFGIFFETYTNFLCHSDSVQQTKNLFVAVTQCKKTILKKYIQFLCAMWQTN